MLRMEKEKYSHSVQKDRLAADLQIFNTK